MRKPGREQVKVILQVYRRDLCRLLHNRLALIVIIGVLFLPSVYAWYTIEANMDPYAHTDAIKVAVVDEDKGATAPTIGTVNAGEEVVAKLKENTELGWEFVSADEAREKVESGAYYAEIVIPEDFSKDLISVFSGNFSPPTIDYYVNEKISAVAPEITNVGASTITASIDSAFIEAVSKTVASIAQSLGDTVKSDESSAQTQLSDAVTRARETLTSLDGALSDFNTVLNDARRNVSDAETALSSMESELSTLESDENEARSTLNDLRHRVATFGTSLTTNLDDAAGAASQAATDEAAAIATAENNLAAHKAELLNQLNSALNQGEAGAAEADRLRQEIAGLDAADSALAAAGNELASALQGLSTALGDASSSLGGTALPDLEASLDDASVALGTLGGATTAAESALSTATTAVKQLSTTIDMAESALTQAKTSLTDVDQSLEDSYSDLEALASSSTIESLSKFLSIDPTQLGEFMAAPVKLQTEVVYPVKNYGSGVAPFFTNLALWVAGFILVALLRMRIDRGREDEDPLPPLTFLESYFGRGALFLTLGLIQGLIVCCGDIVLGIQCDNPAAFIFAGLVTVFVDINILYALVFTMRHLGRAIGVIVLIVQIPGSSGEYPVQMMPAFFQFIHPFLPFTYSIDAMREAIGGMYGAHYWIDLLCLLPFLAGALAFGLICGRYSTNLNVLFDRELTRTQVLISEEADGGTEEQFRLRSVVQALLSTEAYHDELIERMQRFRRRYPYLIRGGWIFVAVVGILALVVGRLLGDDIDAKVIALCCVIVSVFVVLAYQIVVAFINDRLAYQLHVSTLETDDLTSMARDHLSGKRPWASTEPSASIDPSVQSPISETPSSMPTAVMAPLADDSFAPISPVEIPPTPSYIPPPHAEYPTATTDQQPAPVQSEYGPTTLWNFSSPDPSQIPTPEPTAWTEPAPAQNPDQWFTYEPAPTENPWPQAEPAQTENLWQQPQPAQSESSWQQAQPVGYESLWSQEQPTSTENQWSQSQPVQPDYLWSQTQPVQPESPWPEQQPIQPDNQWPQAQLAQQEYQWSQSQPVEAQPLWPATEPIEAPFEAPPVEQVPQTPMTPPEPEPIQPTPPAPMPSVWDLIGGVTDDPPSPDPSAPLGGDRQP